MPSQNNLFSVLTTLTDIFTDPEPIDVSTHGEGMPREKIAMLNQNDVETLWFSMSSQTH